MSDSESNDSSNPYSTPIEASVAPPTKPEAEGDATGGVIPYKNPKALIAYYLAIFGLLFVPLAPIAVILGILGLRDRARNPVIKGSAHAWIGIVLGTLAMFCWGGMIVMMFVGFNA